MKALKAFAVLYVAGLLAACSVFGIAEPSTFSQRLAYAYSTETAVLRATTEALNVGDITSNEAQDISEATEQAHKLLEAASLAVDMGDLDTAEARLQTAVTVLSKLQAYLRAEQ